MLSLSGVMKVLCDWGEKFGSQGDTSPRSTPGAVLGGTFAGCEVVGRCSLGLIKARLDGVH